MEGRPGMCWGWERIWFKKYTVWISQRIGKKWKDKGYFQEYILFVHPFPEWHLDQEEGVTDFRCCPFIFVIFPCWVPTIPTQPNGMVWLIPSHCRTPPVDNGQPLPGESLSSWLNQFQGSAAPFPCPSSHVLEKNFSIFFLFIKSFNHH